jgi:hypothetical protein
MSANEHDFRMTLINLISLWHGLLTRIESSINSAPVGQREELEAIRKRVSDALGVMKGNLQKLT